MSQLNNIQEVLLKELEKLAQIIETNSTQLNIEFTSYEDKILKGSILLKMRELNANFRCLGNIYKSNGFELPENLQGLLDKINSVQDAIELVDNKFVLTAEAKQFIKAKDN